MRVVIGESLDWKAEGKLTRAVLFSEKFGDTQLEVAMLQVPPGGYVPPHTHQKRREFHVVAFSGGAVVQIGDRVFRPLAGQTFEREPGEVLAITNDTEHDIRLMVTCIGYDADDVQWLEPEKVAAEG